MALARPSDEPRKLLSENWEWLSAVEPRASPDLWVVVVALILLQTSFPLSNAPIRMRKALGLTPAGIRIIGLHLRCQRKCIGA